VLGCLLVLSLTLVHADEAALDFYLPVVTPSLTPGEVTPRRVASGITQSLFLIGADPRSRAWLKARGAELTRRQALGFVVNVTTRAELDALRRLVPKLTLTPIPGEALARHFDLEHYPVLITTDGLGP
jgi:integrating conjugative element protein (TIGR03765 family)